MTSLSANHLINLWRRGTLRFPRSDDVIDHRPNGTAGLARVKCKTAVTPHSNHSAIIVPLQWRHNGLDSVSNHQPRHCLLSLLFGRRSKKTSKLRFTGLCAGNSPETGEFPAQMASNSENVSIWWRHRARGFGNSATPGLVSSWLVHLPPW